MSTQTHSITPPVLGARRVLARASVAGLLLTITGTGLVAVNISPADAHTHRCVTKREYRRVHNGMTKGKVHRIFDFNGVLLFENPGAVHNSAREYRMCAAFRAVTGHDTVQVQYNNYATNGGPQRVAYKQHY